MSNIYQINQYEGSDNRIVIEKVPIVEGSKTKYSGMSSFEHSVGMPYPQLIPVDFEINTDNVTAAFELFDELYEKRKKEIIEEIEELRVANLVDPRSS